MLVCDYGPEVERWKVRLIVDRARRFGFAADELADVQQEVILDVMAFRFDQTRSNGATEATALRAVIDRRLKAIRRAKARYERRVEHLKSALGASEGEPHQGQPVSRPRDSASLAVDVRDALAMLSPEDRSLCLGLAEGKTIRQIAAERRCSWSKVQRQVERIRRRFQALGLDGWVTHEE